MDPGEVPTYSVSAIEKRAADLLTRSWPAPVPIPVDVEYLLETQPGVLLDILPGLRDRAGVDGVVYRRDHGAFLVIIDQQIADRPNSHRYRFTVGEELGHVVLHRAVLERVEDIATAVALMNHESYWEMDRNARRFAAATLMPPDEVVAAARRHFPGIIDYLGYAGPGSVMAALSMALGQEFRVSAEAMRYRLRNWPVRIEDRVERALGRRHTHLE
jgi:Zn-dependent peptidase ImmA (M78 family)